MDHSRPTPAIHHINNQQQQPHHRRSTSVRQHHTQQSQPPPSTAAGPTSTSTPAKSFQSNTTGHRGGSAPHFSIVKVPPPPNLVAAFKTSVYKAGQGPPDHTRIKLRLPEFIPGEGAVNGNVTNGMPPTGGGVVGGMLGNAENQQEDDAGSQTPSSTTSFEIKRCDLMWSGNTNSLHEAFTPVENCEIEPVVILACGSDRFDDDDLDGRKSNLEVHYRWRRGPARAVCFFHPHRTATLQCTVTLRCYCGYECFCRGHVQLRRFYTSGGKCAVPRQANEFSYGVPCQKFSPLRQERSRDPDETHHRLLRQAGLVVDPEKEVWPIISYSRNYCPRGDDVGHQLKFEVVVCSKSNSASTDVIQPLNSVTNGNSGYDQSVSRTWNNNNNNNNNNESQQSDSNVIFHNQQHNLHRGLNSGTNAGPRSSPINRQSYGDASSSAGDIEMRNHEEQTFWNQHDSAQTDNGEDERRKSVVTACVVPQVPLIGDRSVIPVGILAVLNGGDTDFSLPQRVIIPGSPLAEALGIGLIPDRAVHKIPKRLRVTGEVVSMAGGDAARTAFWQHNSLPLRKEKERNAVKEKRVALLTENAFAAWKRSTQRPAAADTAHRTSNSGEGSLNGIKSHSNPSGSSSAAARNAEFSRAMNGLNSSSTNLGSAITGNAKHLTANTGSADTTPGAGGGIKSSGGTINQQTVDMGGESFSVMTWNVLADIYATMEAYPYSEPFVLAWNYRKGRILAEIIAYNPDIICLQEVQGDHFEDFFAPALLRRGYEGLYKQKTSKIFRGSGKHRGGRYVCDGCATFFRVPKFRLADHFGIEFARVAPPGSRNDKRLNKDNVALVLCLEQLLPTGISNRNGKTPGGLSKILLKDGGQSEMAYSRQLIVANAHILANPEAPDVKIWQAHTLTSVLTEYMEKTYACSHNREVAMKHTSLVVCGDFNSTPDSAVYQLVTSGKCDSRHEELQSSEIYRWLHEIPLGHGLNLKSSYGVASSSRMEANRAMTNGNNNPTSPYITNYHLYEPEFTNYTHQYVGCLDYIFFDDRTLKITGTLDLVREIQLMEEAHSLQLSDWALPSPQRPSDHTPLLARFEWIR